MAYEDGSCEGEKVSKAIFVPRSHVRQLSVKRAECVLGGASFGRAFGLFEAHKTIYE